jgi:LysM repeat protein
MVSRGSAFDSAPKACPFIALELDRDRRSERPDYRHRCYAEQVPAPRTIAHQERYCLSPNFSGCPIFQDWALRAAARPVPLPAGYEGRRGPDAARAAASAAGSAGIASNVAEAQQWPDSMDATSAAAASAAAASLAGSDATEQLGAFDAPPESAAEPAASPARQVEPEPEAEPEVVREPHASPGFEEDEAAAGAAALGGVGFASIDPPSRVEPESIPSNAVADDEPPPDADPTEAAVPAFLAARSARPKAPPTADGPITREEVVPSWDLTDRYGAQSAGRGEREPSDDGTFGKMLTAVAIVIILALGIAAVVMIPGLLNGPGATTTTRPTLALASRTPGASLVGVIATPTVAPATATITPETTAEPTPGATPRSYRVKAGDTLAKIAKKFKITVAALTEANPELSDADHIEVGQVLIIPPRAAN